LSRPVAERFGNVLFVIHATECPCIAEASAHPYEGEVLFPEQSYFLVDGVTREPSGRVVIELRDLRTMPDFTYKFTPEEAGEGAILIRVGADVDARDCDGSRPLHHAARRGHAKTVEILLRAGAEVDALDRKGLTPLYGAALEGGAETVRILLLAGADVDAAGGETPIHGAALGGCTEKVRILLHAGANPSSKSRGHSSALHTAVAGRSPSVLRLLLEAGPDAQAKDGNGFTALEYAEIEARKNPDVEECVRVLRQTS
jgi:ankyrin repeat protein